MIFNQFLIIIFLCFLSSGMYAAESKNSLNNEIKNILDENRFKYNIPAISLSIKLPNSNKINDYVTGYYSLSKKEKITPKTLFQIGSITKTFVATIIFKLIEENKISDKDSLTKWLPEYPRWKNITIYDLLHHTSGIYNYTSGKSFDDLLKINPQRNWSLIELANMAYKHPDYAKPSKKYNYTNTDYVLLGIIIEKATHRPIQQVFDDYLKQYDLVNTFYSPFQYPNSVKNRIAHGYNRDGTFKFNTDVTFVSMSFGQSAGAMIATTHDLINWLNKLFTGKIITYESLKAMTKVISEKNIKAINIKEISNPNKLVKSKPFAELGVGAGIGLIYLKNNGIIWVHAGGTPGYESLYAYDPCKGIYLTLAYNVKPKQQLIFIQIADEIFQKLNNTPEVVKAIKIYQKNNLLPDYCDAKA